MKKNQPQLFNVMLNGQSKALRELHSLAAELGKDPENLIDWLLDGVLAKAKGSKRERKKLVEAVQAGMRRHDARISHHERRSDRYRAKEIADGIREGLPARIVIPMDRLTTVRLVPVKLAKAA